MLLTPEYIFRAIEAITPEFLRQHGITALVLDVDNTLTGKRYLQTGGSGFKTDSDRTSGSLPFCLRGTEIRAGTMIAKLT